MTATKVRATVLATLVVLSTVPAPVAAQPIPRHVLFDQGNRHVASVTVDDRTYEVYRFDNLIPYASGVEIYRDGERVTSEATAREVLTRLARRRAVEELGPDDLELLRSSRRAVSGTVANVSAAADALEGATTTVADLRTSEIDGRNAYDVAVAEAPTIRQFNDTATRLQPKLRSYVRDSRAFTENASKLETLIERRESGSTVRTERLYDRYLATLRAMEAVSDHVEYGGFDDELSTLSRQSETIAENVSSVPQRGSALAEQFSRVHDRTGVAGAKTGAIDLPDYSFNDVRERAESIRTTLMNQWQTRQNAPMDIYKTLGGVAVGVALLGGYIELRRR